MIKYNFAAERVWNLDETGNSPGRDARVKILQKRYMRRSSGKDAQVAGFTNTNLVTVLPCISAAGDVRPAMFIFKGTKMPFRQALVDDTITMETYDSYLPRGSPVDMREEVAEVDSN